MFLHLLDLQQLLISVSNLLSKLLLIHYTSIWGGSDSFGSKQKSKLKCVQHTRTTAIELHIIYIYIYIESALVSTTVTMGVLGSGVAYKLRFFGHWMQLRGIGEAKD